MTDQIVDRLTTMLRAGVLDGSDRDVEPDAPLGEEGVGLDSLALVQFLSAVEREFRAEVPMDVWAEIAGMSLRQCAELLARVGR